MIKNRLYDHGILAIFIFLVSTLAISVTCIASEEYLVGVGDILKISVYDHPDLDTISRVSGNGNIHIPLIGNVNVKNISTEQLSIKLEHLFADGYLVNPKVNVFVEEFRSKKAIILGKVRRPGLYELSGPTTLLELISKAGGLTNDASNSATIKRSDLSGKNKNLITVDLVTLLEHGDVSQNIMLQNEDSVFIAKAGMAYVTGEVKKPNAYKVEKDSTILKFVTIAGGFTGKAAENRIKLIRIINGHKNELKNVSMDTKIKTDDIIIVPESYF